VVSRGAHQQGCIQLHRSSLEHLFEGSWAGLLRGHQVCGVGRAASAAAATGFPSVHAQEQSELVKKALQVEPIKLP